ncbi:DNRLRE domain-containing protein [Nonomuraea sp. NPDC049695]|uniref:DNRLRE domain-containing protein n=1 Tax=Nonomuraea sp. NPDC049695 TaxID=3154734 RepID=UPI00341F18BB
MALSRTRVHRTTPADRAIAAVLSVALAVTVADIPTAYADTPSPQPPQAAIPPDPSTAPAGPSAPDESSAKLTARLTGKRVEIESARTEASSTYANPDGTLTEEMFAGPVRVRDGAGWKPVDLALTAAADGTVTPKSHGRALRIGGGASGAKQAAAAGTDLISVAAGDARVTLRWPGALPSPQVSGQSVTYPGVLPGADLTVTATRTGAEQFLLLKQRPTAPLSYRLRLDAPGLKARQAKDGGVELVGKGGKVAATVPAPVMWDARVDQSSGEHPHRAPVKMEVSGKDLVLTPDPAFLNDPATAYPVTVDPSVNVGEVFDTFVQQGYNTDNSASTELKLGNNGSGQIAKSFITWNTSGLAGQKIISATLNLWNFHSWSCTAKNWEVWSADQASASSRYPGPAMAAKYATSSQTKGFSSSCADGWVSANVTSLAQYWADKGWAKSGMGLRASDESDPYGWKRFNSGNAASHTPYIAVTYNGNPSTPLSVWTSPNSEVNSTLYTNSATPRLYAHVGDADGGNVRAKFEVYDGSTAVITGLYGAYVASGGFSDAAVPAGKLANGRTYTLKGWGNDGSLDSLQPQSRQFTVDTTRPPAPKLTSGSHPDSGWHGDAGEAASFTATPADSDVAKIAYRLDDGDTATAATTGAAVTFTVAPQAAGPHTLTTYALDRAGNASEAVTYRFNVGAGALAAPADGTRTARRTELAATGRGEYDRVTFQWRRASTDTWADIPVAQVLGADGKPLTAWPVAAKVADGTATVSGLTWNLVDQLGGDGAVQVRAVFANASDSASTPAADVVADRQASGAETQNVGPGSVNLLTGDFRVEESEAELFGLALSRTISSRDPKAGAKIASQASPFGPEWSAGGVSDVADSEYAALRETSASSVEVTLVDGTPIQFTKTGSGWKPEEGAEDLTLTGSYTLKDADGVVTTFTKPSGATSYLPATTTPPGANNITRYVYEAASGAQRLKAVIAPTSGVSDLGTDCALPSPKTGCRVLELVYATQTGGGDYAGRVKQVLFHDSGTPVAVAQYAYDGAGRLVQSWDPRIAPALKTAYGYDTGGRLTSLTSPGQLPWTFVYDADGRLTSAVRQALKAGTADQVEGENRTSIVYNVPLDKAAGGPADLRPQHTAAWGQHDNPTDATAVFPGDQIPDGRSWTRATVTYLDANGRQVNQLTPGGHLSATEHDKFGNVVRELSEGNRELALGASPRLAELGLSGLPTAERAELLSKRSTYNDDGTRELETLGPLHVVSVGGEDTAAREHTVSTYDQGRPGDAPTKDLVTRTEVSARLLSGEDRDTRVTATEYDWALGKPLKTVKDPGGLNLVTATSYDGDGNPVKSVLPKGNDAATTITTYYTASGSAPCGGKPAWAGLVCRTAPAGKITGGGDNPDELPTAITTYDRYGNPLTVSETANGVTRVTNTAYDPAGRQIRQWITGGVGEALGAVATVYAPDSGEVAELQRLDAAGNVTERIVSAYDKLGRRMSYTDADAGVVKTEYDLLDRTTKVTDSAPSTVTYGYDTAAEPRGLAVTMTDSVAGTFTARYDADGEFASGDLPGGLHVSVTDDETGTDVSRVYTKDGLDQPVLSEQVIESVHGQWAADARGDAGYERAYGYDKAGRLTSARESAGGVCTLRRYAFDDNSNRTRLATQSQEGTCPEADDAAAEITSYAYDSGDRLVGDGYRYDALGRTTALPGGTTFDYHVNDLARRQTAGDQTMTWSLDPADRFRSTAAAAGTVVNHYGSEGDSPRWSAEPGGNVLRNVSGFDGDLAAITGANGDIRLQLTTLHGDVGTEYTLGTATATVVDADEYGVARGPARRYGWLGGKQRAADTLDGTMLMGVRLYNPSLGRFLQLDPVEGGSANAYEYCSGDPVNCTDLDGKWGCGWCRKLRHKARHVWRRAKVHYRSFRYGWNTRRGLGGFVHRWASSGRRWVSRGSFIVGVGFGTYSCLRRRTMRGCAKAYWENSAIGGLSGALYGIGRGAWRGRHWWRRTHRW